MIKYLSLYRDYLIVNMGYSMNTVNAYAGDIKQYFSLNMDVEAYFRWLKSREYSEASENRKLAALKGYYAYLLKNNYISRNPFFNVECAKQKRKIPQYLTYNEILKILEYFKKDLLANALIEVLYGCGLRVSELINLKMSDIHYQEGIIECFGKGSKKRYVPINLCALRAIEDYKIGFRSKLKRKDSEDILFLNNLPYIYKTNQRA